MDIKKLFIGTIAGGIVFFFLGWLIYGMLLHDFMLNNTGGRGNLERNEMKFFFIIIGNLASAMLLTWIFLKANINSLAAGLMAGAVIGFLMSVAVDCVEYATTYVLSKKSMAADVIAFTVMTAIAGAVIGALTGGAKRNV